MNLADKIEGSTADIAGLVEILGATLPLLDGLETGRDCEDYAFAKANLFRAMTYCPEAFEALRCIPEAAATLTAQAREIERLNKRVVDEAHSATLLEIALRAICEPTGGTFPDAEVCRCIAFIESITALEAEKAELVDALEPLARKKIPSNGTGNAGAYSIYHSDIRRARATLAKARQS